MEKQNAIIILDNGHGIETPGKRSPDSRIREYSYAREIVAAVSMSLVNQGYKVQVLVPEDRDVSLSVRTRRANAICYSYGVRNCLLVSVHLDAFGNGSDWMEGRGWSARVATIASRQSKELAGYIFDEAERAGLKVRRQEPGKKYWVQNLAICRDVACAAVLTENLFMDNKKDVEILESVEGFNKIVNIHVEGIKNYIDRL